MKTAAIELHPDGATAVAARLGAKARVAESSLAKLDDEKLFN